MQKIQNITKTGITIQFRFNTYLDNNNITVIINKKISKLFIYLLYENLLPTLWGQRAPMPRNETRRKEPVSEKRKKEVN